MGGARRLWSNVSTHNNVWNAVSRSSDTEWGISGHMGSTIMKTNYGHEQIISVFKVRINTSNVKQSGTSPIGFNNLYETGIVVHVDDITDGTHWEEALYQHTAVNERPQATTQLVGQSRGKPMAYLHGNYETGREKSRQAWVRVTLKNLCFLTSSEIL